MEPASEQIKSFSCLEVTLVFNKSEGFSVRPFRNFDWFNFAAARRVVVDKVEMDFLGGVFIIY